jgi:DNA-binding IclR family transcriptional regulator
MARGRWRRLCAVRSGDDVVTAISVSGPISRFKQSRIKENLALVLSENSIRAELAF